MFTSPPKVAPWSFPFAVARRARRRRVIPKSICREGRGCVRIVRRSESRVRDRSSGVSARRRGGSRAIRGGGRPSAWSHRKMLLSEERRLRVQRPALGRQEARRVQSLPRGAVFRPLRGAARARGAPSMSSELVVGPPPSVPFAGDARRRRPRRRCPGCWPPMREQRRRRRRRSRYERDTLGVGAVRRVLR